VSGGLGNFWKSFALGYAGSGVVPPPPSGVADLVLNVRGEADVVEALGTKALRLWVPRKQLRDIDGETHIIGPLRGMHNANRRKTGLVQTIELLDFVSPTGKNKDGEIRLLALSSLHFLITKKLVVSQEVHDTAADLVAVLKLNSHASGWRNRTEITLPLQSAEAEVPPVEDDLGDIGKWVGAQVGRHLHDYIPANVALRPTRSASAKSVKEVSKLVSGLRMPSPPIGTLSWRLMTPGKVRELVWKHPLKDISERYGVSGTAIKKYCTQNAVSVPGSGYWRMTDESREELRSIMRSLSAATVHQMLSEGSIQQAAERLDVSPIALKGYCKMNEIVIPDGRRQRHQGA